MNERIRKLRVHVPQGACGLKMNGHKKHFPKEGELKRFGKRIGVQQPGETIHLILDTVSDTLKKYSDLLQDYQFIAEAMQKSIAGCIKR